MVNALAWEIMHRSKQLSVRVRFRLLHELLERQLPWPPYVPELSLRQIYDSAETRYLPKPLSGASAVLVRARIGEGDDTPYREIYADETFGWGVITQGLTIVDVEGGHSSMLQEPFVESLAAALMPHLSRKSKQAHPLPVEPAMS
jgi:thioesterase domain-containing protein